MSASRMNSSMQTFVRHLSVAIVLAAGLFGCAADAQQTEDATGSSESASTFLPQCENSYYCPGFAGQKAVSWMLSSSNPSDAKVVKFETALYEIVKRHYPDAKPVDLTNPNAPKYWRGFGLSCWGNDWTDKDIADFNKLVQEYAKVSPVNASAHACREGTKVSTDYIRWDPGGHCAHCSNAF